MKYLAIILLLAAPVYAQQASVSGSPNDANTTGTFLTDLPGTTLNIGNPSTQEKLEIVLDPGVPILFKHYNHDGEIDWIVMRDGTFIALQSNLTLDADSRKFWKTFAGAFHIASFTAPCVKVKLPADDKGR